MSAGTWAWESVEGSGDAGARLDGFVRDLTRARRLQILVDLAWGGLFFGLLAACIPVLAIALTGSSWPQWPSAAAVLALFLAAAGLLAWRRRPDALDVSILADLELGLDQRLSTAWEFALRVPGTPLAARLAAQALARKVPLTHLVFPLRINLWGRLAPLALLLLGLIGLTDLGSPSASPSVSVDPVVAEEGARLREHGRRMEARAKRESLPRSGERAGDMQRLGARMESGSTSRRQALSRLRELDDALEHERRTMLMENLPPGAAELPPQSLAGAPIFSEGRLGALLGGLRQGALTLEELEVLGMEATALSALGIAPAEIEEALARFASGEYEALRALLEKLSDIDTALREGALLWDAERAIELARENLGETGVMLGFRREGEGTPSEGDGSLALLNARYPVRMEDESGPFVAFRGPGRGEGPQSESPPSISPRSTRQPEGAVLELKGRPGEGEVYRSEARVLPRAGKASAPVTALSPEFRDEVEAVLARQGYPRQHKELVRRYFLALSAGSAVEGATENTP